MKFFLFAASALSLFAAVDGTVVNATTGNPQGSVIVTLVQPGSQGMQTLASVKSDAQGKFTIDKDFPPGMALLQGLYEGATYNLVLPPGGPTSGLHITVYDSTSKPGVAKVSQHMVLIEPSTTKLDISETFILENQTNTTFADPEKGSIQFYLPDAAKGKANVTEYLPAGMTVPRSAEKTKDKNIYKIPYPVKPGETRFDISYSLPPTESFSSEILHGEGVTRLVTASTVTLSGDGIDSLGQEPQTKANIYNAGGSKYTVQIAGIGSLRADTAPEDDAGNQDQLEEKPARVYSQMTIILVMVFVILALGGVVLYRKSVA